MGLKSDSSGRRRDAVMKTYEELEERGYSVVEIERKLRLNIKTGELTEDRNQREGLNTWDSVEY